MKHKVKLVKILPFNKKSKELLGELSKIDSDNQEHYSSYIDILTKVSKYKLNKPHISRFYHKKYR